MNSVIHKIYALILISLPLFTGCEKIDANTDSQETLDTKSIVLPDNAENISLGVNEFAFDIMGTMTGEKESYVFSPLGLYTVLAMAREGAAGQTLSEMDNVLHSESLPTLSIKEYCRAVLMYAQASDDLDLATSVWIDSSCKLKQTFTETIGSYWLSDVNKCCLSDANTLDAINSWCYENTNGKIPRAINSISPDALLLFINALYFKNAWNFTFEDIGTGEFTKFDGTVLTKKFLCKEGGLRYSKRDKYQIATISYKDYRQEMIMVLPAEGVSMAQVLADFQPEDFERWVDKSPANPVRLIMPSFVIQKEFAAKEILSKLGMSSAFSGNADFSNMTKKSVRISKVLQQTNLTVDKRGSEGSSMSLLEAVAGASGNGGPELEDFIANRPFLFFIRDSFTKAILFAGMYAGE